MPGQPSSGDPASTTYPADWHATLPVFRWPVGLCCSIRTTGCYS